MLHVMVVLLLLLLLLLCQEVYTEENKEFELILSHNIKLNLLKLYTILFEVKTVLRINTTTHLPDNDITA